MKKLAFVVSILCVVLVAVGAALAANVTVGHSGWQWGNPQPQGDTLNAIDFAGGTGYAAGDFGTVLKTTDGGQTWAGIPTGITGDLQQVRVLDAKTVFIGAGCLLRHSDDGGATFARIPLLSNCVAGSGLVSFSYTSATSGYLLLANGTVEQNNGSTSFALRTALPGTAATGASPGATPTDIYFLSSMTGIATAGGTIYRTTDGANSWNQQYTGGPTLNGLYFADTMTGYAVGDGKTVLKTTDGGITWTPKPVPAGFPAADLTKIRCAPGSATLCVATSRQGDQFLRTTDGGDHWESKKASTKKIFAMAFNSATNAVGVGEGGATVVSLDGANTFTQVGSSPLAGAVFSRLRATSSAVVTAPGNSGTLARTTDGGQTWSKVGVATAQNVVDASFPTADTGFALDSSGGLFKSTDGGVDWTPLDTGGIAPPRAVFAPDPLNVLLIGPRGVVLSKNATDFASTGSKALRKAALSDYDRTASGQVFVFGPRALFVTSNKGRTFKAIHRPGGKRASIRKVDFLSGRVGYVLDADGRVWATKNGGRGWRELVATGTRGAYDMAWGDARNGYLSVSKFGTDSGRGFVLRTSDGGASWRPQLVAPAPFAPNGLVATAPSTAFGLSGDNALFFTSVGGDQGAQSTLSIRSNVKSVGRKAVTATIKGKLRPALANEDVFVMVRALSGGAWHVLHPHGTSGSGSFTIKTKIRRASYVVAQWDGDSATNGDGSNLVTIKRR